MAKNTHRVVAHDTENGHFFPLGTEVRLVRERRDPEKIGDGYALYEGARENGVVISQWLGPKHVERLR